jgi:hypothetical protein
MAWPTACVRIRHCLSMPWRDYLRAIFLSESDFGPSRKEKEIKPKAVRDKYQDVTKNEKTRFIIVADGVRNKAAHPEQVRTK